MFLGIKWYWWALGLGVGALVLSSSCQTKTKTWVDKIAARHGWKDVRVVPPGPTSTSWSLVVNTMSVETQQPMDVTVVSAASCEALEAQAKQLAAVG